MAFDSSHRRRGSGRFRFPNLTQAHAGVRSPADRHSSHELFLPHAKLIASGKLLRYPTSGLGPRQSIAFALGPDVWAASRES